MRREAVGAVVTAPGDAPHVEAILMDPPGPEEVLVRIVASGGSSNDPL